MLIEGMNMTRLQENEVCAVLGDELAVIVSGERSGIDNNFTCYKSLSLYTNKRMIIKLIVRLYT